MKTRTWQRTIVAALFTLTACANAGDDAKPVASATNSTPPAAISNTAVTPLVAAPVATNAEAVRVIQMPKISLPPLLDQVVKLSQSGADETLIRAYVEKAASPYRITGNDIVQLRDLGISQPVIMSLIEHSQAADVANVTEMVGPQNPAQEPQPPPQVTNAEAPLSSPEAVADFYDPLSPYGTWLDVPGYGRCWQPTVVVVNPGWRPYCDNGSWLWSDCGWYWNSYYSWGWAPFHYGRWFSYPSRGWMWCPDRVWGPSWVSWRNSGAYCGWAPLPPGACFTAGLGWSFRGAHVGVDFGFGLASAQFTFVARDRFSDHHVGRHALNGSDAQTAFHRASVVNDYAVGSNNRIINRGIGRDTIAAASRTPVREVAVRELPRGSSAIMPDRVNRAGNSEVVYRPGAQISVPRTTTVNAPSQRLARQASVAPTAPSSQVFNQRALSRSSVVGNSPPQRLIQNQSPRQSDRSLFVQPRQSGSATPMPRWSQAPGSQNNVYARAASPASIASRAPSVMASPRFSAPSGGGRSPSYGGGGGGQLRGSVSHGSSSAAPSHGLRR